MNDRCGCVRAHGYDLTGKMTGGGLRSVAWASAITLVESSVIALTPPPSPRSAPPSLGAPPPKLHRRRSATQNPAKSFGHLLIIEMYGTVRCRYIVLYRTGTYGIPVPRYYLLVRSHCVSMGVFSLNMFGGIAQNRCSQVLAVLTY